MRKQGMSTEAHANEETSGRGILLQRHILDIFSNTVLRQNYNNGEFSYSKLYFSIQ